MGIERLQQLPAETQQSAANVAFNTLGLMLGIVLLACWAATEYAAYHLGCQPALGEPVLTYGWFKLYMPFDFFVWMVSYGHVEGTEQAWQGGEWILFCLHFLIVPAIWLSVRRYKKSQGKTDLHGSAHWATRAEIERTSLLGDSEGGGGCYVGAWWDARKNQTVYLTHNGPEHIIALAPTRSGKGVGLVLPTLLSWKQSTVVHDIKGEAWALTAGYRHRIGHKTLKFEPAADDGTSVCYNPLEEIRLRTPREVADAQNIAQMIVDPDGKGMEDHWAKTGHELLSGAILHVLYSYPTKTLSGLVSFFCDPSKDIEQVAEDMLNAQHDPTGSQGWTDAQTGAITRTNPMVAKAARSFLNKSENERSGVQSTAMSYLTVYDDPIVAMNTAVSEFRIKDLMRSETPVSLYIVIAPNDKARLRPLVRLLMNQIFRLSTEKMEFADGRSIAGYKHRLLMMLDEFPSLGRLEQVEEALAFVAGYGIKCYLITQDLSQLQKAYGKDEAIIANCHVRIAYAPNQINTAEWLSKTLGSMTVHRQQQNISGNRLSPWLGHVMVAEQDTQRSLLTADEVMRLPGAVKSDDGVSIIQPGDMLIMVAGHAPIYGQQILYFQDPTFSQRSKLPAPKTSDRITIRADKKIHRLDTHPAPPLAVAGAMPTACFHAAKPQPEMLEALTVKSPVVERELTPEQKKIFDDEEVAAAEFAAPGDTSGGVEAEVRRYDDMMGATDAGSQS